MLYLYFYSFVNFVLFSWIRIFWHKPNRVTTACVPPCCPLVLYREWMNGCFWKCNSVIRNCFVPDANKTKWLISALFTCCRYLIAKNVVIIFIAFRKKCVRSHDACRNLYFIWILMVCTSIKHIGRKEDSKPFFSYRII